MSSSLTPQPPPPPPTEEKPPPPLEVLSNVFPGRPKPILESVLQDCHGDVAKALEVCQSKAKSDKRPLKKLFKPHSDINSNSGHRHHPYGIYSGKNSLYSSPKSAFGPPSLPPPPPPLPTALYASSSSFLSPYSVPGKPDTLFPFPPSLMPPFYFPAAAAAAAALSLSSPPSLNLSTKVEDLSSSRDQCQSCNAESKVDSTDDKMSDVDQSP